MSERAYRLAALRARGVSPTEDAPEVDERVVQGTGRRLVPVGAGRGPTGVALGWARASEPDADAWGLGVQRFSPSALAVLATCLGLCWPDPAHEPYPGRPAATADVLGVTTRLGLDGRWAKSALLRELPGAGYLTIDETGSTDTTVRLGPAVATWPSDQVALLRREHHRLPRIEERS